MLREDGLSRTADKPILLFMRDLRHLMYSSSNSSWEALGVGDVGDTTLDAQKHDQ